MTAPRPHSPASPPPLPLAKTPAMMAAVAPARGGNQPLAPLSADAVPVLVDAQRLQGQFDDEGAALVVRRYRIVPDRQVPDPPPLQLRRDALLMPPLIALLVVIGTLAVAMVRGGLL